MDGISIRWMHPSTRRQRTRTNRHGLQPSSITQRKTSTRLKTKRKHQNCPTTFLWVRKKCRVSYRTWRLCSKSIWCNNKKKIRKLSIKVSSQNSFNSIYRKVRSTKWISLTVKSDIRLIQTKRRPSSPHRYWLRQKVNHRSKTEWTVSQSCNSRFRSMMKLSRVFSSLKSPNHLLTTWFPCVALSSTARLLPV